MKKNFSLLASLMILIALMSCKQANTANYEVKKATDSNGFTYEYVTNDQVDCRIYKLENGLTVYLSKNEIEPRVSTLIGVRAGSTSEDLKSTGLAHYFEHMMFKGTDKMGTTDWEKEGAIINQISETFELRRNSKDPKEQAELYKRIDSLSLEAAKYAIPGEYDKCVSEMGASGTNAFTSYDMTVYINEIPSNQLEKWMKIEADRFENIKLRLFHTELETVYEEFNMGQDNDYRRAGARVMEALFQNHPYSRNVIGLPEHLKFPSMKDIYKFHETYYVPNNMAVALSGDIDYDKTIKMINDYFGRWERKDLPQPANHKADPITEHKTIETFGPNAEMLDISFCFDNTEENSLKIEAINTILYNGTCGLIDLDLVQQQKVMNAFCYNMSLNDYIVHSFRAMPKQGQTLDELKDLLMAELQKIKDGEFEDWILEAAINNNLKDIAQSFEKNDNRTMSFMMNFMEGKPYIDLVTYNDKLAKITKKDVIEFAKKYYNENYVVGYKRIGVDKSIVKVDKPEISAVPINRDAKSDFAQEISEMQADHIEPLFIDYNKAIDKTEIKDGYDFYYTKKNINDIFKLYYLVDMGKDADLKIPLALNYLTYLGTDKYTPEQLKQELYKLALDFNVKAGNDMSYVYISGLNSKFEEAIKLIEHILHNVKADQDAYNNYVDRIMTERKDIKTNQNQILWSAMRYYAIYGADNPSKDRIPEEELRNINPEELIDIVKDLFNFKHLVYYCGSKDKKDVIDVVKKYHTVADKLKELPEEKEYNKIDINENNVYLVNYDMVQAHMLMISRGDKFDVKDIPYINIFGEYYGGGLSSIIFQEVRESRSLAYTALASINSPSKKDDYNSIYGFVGTQSDKLSTSISVMNDLMNNMPVAEKQFEIAKESVLKKIETERIVQDEVFFRWYVRKKQGIDYDYRKDVYNTVKKMNVQEFEKYFNEHIAGKKYSYMILGNVSTFNMDDLNKLGKVHQLTLEEIFGY